MTNAVIAAPVIYICMIVMMLICRIVDILDYGIVYTTRYALSVFVSDATHCIIFACITRLYHRAESL